MSAQSTAYTCINHRCAILRRRQPAPDLWNCPGLLTALQQKVTVPSPDLDAAAGALEIVKGWARALTLGMWRKAYWPALKVNDAERAEKYLRSASTEDKGHADESVLISGSWLKEEFRLKSSVQGEFPPAAT